VTQAVPQLRREGFDVLDVRVALQVKGRREHMKKSDVGVETIAQFLHVGENCFGTLTAIDGSQYPCNHPTPPSSRWSDAPPRDSAILSGMSKEAGLVPDSIIALRCAWPTAHLRFDCGDAN
jgi:hypothetical protein